MTAIPILLVVILALALALVWSVKIRWFRGRTTKVTTYSSVEKIKEMGDLVALSVFFKEISTARSGRIPILMSEKNVAMICEFDVEWRYDLRKIREYEKDGVKVIELPAPGIKVNTGRIEMHSMEEGKLLGIIPVNKLSVTNYNELVSAARESAIASAKKQLATNLASRVERSARQTLSFLLDSAGAGDVQIEFASAEKLSDDIENSIRNTRLDQVSA